MNRSRKEIQQNIEINLNVENTCSMPTKKGMKDGDSLNWQIIKIIDIWLVLHLTDNNKKKWADQYPDKNLSRLFCT